MKSNAQNQPAMMREETGGETFLANRATGRIKIAAAAERGRTHRRHVAESGSLRARFPNNEDVALDAVIVNTAGGIAGGDHHALDISVEQNARLVVTTAAAEKVYRSLGPDAAIDVSLKVADGGRLSWLPQETILFDRSHLSRRIDVALSGKATLVLAEMVVFGRSAMGERVKHGAFRDSWRISHDGRLLFAETVQLDGLISQKLAEPGVAAGGVSVATVFAFPGNDTMVADVRTLQDSFAGEVGISAWNGFSVARLCAKDGASVRSDLVAMLTAMRVSLPRIWLN